MFIMSNVEMNKMFAKLPLSTKILCTLKLAMVAEMSEMQTSQIVVGECDGPVRMGYSRGKVVNFFFSSPTGTSGVSSWMS